MINPPHPSELPQFSLAERDRRWARVREAMAREGMDVIIAPPHTGHWGQFQADVRYLTQFGINMYEAIVVFPLEGEVMAATRSGQHQAWLRDAYEWVKDVRDTGGGNWSNPVVERMHELGYDENTTKRVGVVGTGRGLVRSPEGIIRYNTMVRLMEAFPKVEWVNASEVMNEVRSVKSPEEIAFHERAGQIADKAVEALIEHARPGIVAQTLWAHMHSAMLFAGGEYPSMINWDIRPDMTYPARHPTYRVVQQDDYCINEIEAKFNGYIHQTNHPLYVGKAPDNYRRTFDACLEAFNAASAVARPGNSIGDMVRATEGVFAKYPGIKGGHLQLHGRGLGEDRPLLSRGASERNNAILLEEGNVFIVKPGCGDVGKTGYSFRMTVGDTCVVTATGLRRLSQHHLELSQVSV